MARSRSRKNDPSTGNFSLDDYPFYLMTRTMAEYYAALEKALKAVGVDQPRWRVLMILGAKTPSTMSELVGRSVIKSSTMTRLIQRMQRQGLVRSSRHPKDSRISEVFLTSMGEDYLRMVKNVGGQIFRRAFATVTPANLSTFVATLKTLIANISRSPFELDHSVGGVRRKTVRPKRSVRPKKKR